MKGPNNLVISFFSMLCLPFEIVGRSNFAREDTMVSFSHSATPAPSE